VHVKPLDQITAKWSQRAAAAGPAYQTGVQNPRISWQQATTAAAPNWGTGVQAAISNGRFVKGVAAAGDSKWSAGATGKGVTRYPQGVQAPAAMTNFSNGFGKFAQVLSNLTLPPKFAKGDPQNQARSTAVQIALHNAKVGK